MHGKDPMQEEFFMHEGYPSQEGTSSQGGPSAWFLNYFGKLNEIMERMQQCQEENAKQLGKILQNQEKYIDRLENFYENLNEQQIALNQ